MQELLDRIMKEQDSFPAAQKQVAAYIVDNYYQIPFLSITSLARNIGVSDTTIIKFCNQLGFSGFGDFKKVFSDFVHSELIMYNKLSRSSLSPASANTPFAEVLEEDMANIQSTLSNPINLDNINHLIQMIQSAQGIYTVGGRSSAALAEHLACTLRYLGLQVHALTNGIEDFFDRVSTIQKEDLIIAFCFPRYTRLIVESLRDLHEKGVPIVLITDTGLSAAYPYADLVFHCSVTSNSYFPCYASCMSLINVICRATGAALNPNAAIHVRDLEKLLLERGIFL